MDTNDFSKKKKKQKPDPLIRLPIGDLSSIRSVFGDSFQSALGNLSIFLAVLLTRVWRGDKENKNMDSENHFNQTVLRGDKGWHRRALYLIRALPVVIGRNTQSGFYWITPALYRRGFTVIEQHRGRRGDSQMVLIKLRDDSYYVPCCSLTLLEAYCLASIPEPSHTFYDWDTHVCNYPLIRQQSSQISSYENSYFICISLPFNLSCNFHLNCACAKWFRSKLSWTCTLAPRQE